MQDINLLNYHISNFHFDTNLNGPTKLELKYGFAYNVGYSADNKTCQGELKVTVDGGKKLKLEATVAGIFQVKPGMAKEQIHIKTYDMLYPYTRVLIATIISGMGLPPIHIPYVDISNQSIITMPIIQKLETEE